MINFQIFFDLEAQFLKLYFFSKVSRKDSASMSLDLSIFQDAAPYLRMSDERKMEIMAQQIAMAKQIGGPKPVWVPTPENPDVQYTRGKN